MEVPGACLYAGYIASVADWRRFVPQWCKWVLNGKPKLEYYHASEIRNASKQRELGIDEPKATRIRRYAHKVIKENGTLRPVMVKMNTAPFAKAGALYGKTLKRPGRKPAKIKYEHVGFYRYIRASVCIIEQTEPSATLLNFMTEAQDRALALDFEDILEFVRAEYLSEGKQSSADLLGCVYAQDKRRPPLQAADLAAWLMRRVYDNDVPELERKLGIQALHGKGWKWEIPDPITVDLGDRLIAVSGARTVKKQTPCPAPEDEV